MAAWVWPDRTPCAENPDEFFPARHEKPTSARTRRARRTCIQCPFRRACIEVSYEQRREVSDYYDDTTGRRMVVLRVVNIERDGIWGGATPSERAAVANLPPAERFEALESWLRAAMSDECSVADPSEWVPA